VKGFVESWKKKKERKKMVLPFLKWQHPGRGDNLRKQNLIKANSAIATSGMTDTLSFG